MAKKPKPSNRVHLTFRYDDYWNKLLDGSLPKVRKFVSDPPTYQLAWAGENRNRWKGKSGIMMTRSGVPIEVENCEEFKQQAMEQRKQRAPKLQSTVRWSQHLHKSERAEAAAAKNSGKTVKPSKPIRLNLQVEPSPENCIKLPTIRQSKLIKLQRLLPKNKKLHKGIDLIRIYSINSTGYGCSARLGRANASCTSKLDLRAVSGCINLDERLPRKPQPPQPLRSILRPSKLW